MDLNLVTKYVEDNIGTFHQKKLESLNSLRLKRILKRKNPYLFKAKNVNSASEIVKSIVDAFISSNEETIFGDWLEGLAIYINTIEYAGWKSGIEGIDLEFDKDNIRYIVSIKSGPHWGNSTQKKQLQKYFTTAQRTLKTSNSQINVNPVLGICYGRNKNIEQGNFSRYLGQDFWEFISGDKNLYTEIIEPLGHKAKEQNEAYKLEYDKKINLLTLEFSKDFCKLDGSIDWDKILKLNSASYR